MEQKNFAIETLEKAHKANADWLNQIQDAIAFAKADGMTLEQKDLDLLEDLERKDRELRAALLTLHGQGAV